MRPILLEAVSMRVHFHVEIELVQDNGGKKVSAERMSQGDVCQDRELRLDASCEKRGSFLPALVEGGSCQVQFGEYHTMV